MHSIFQQNVHEIPWFVVSDHGHRSEVHQESSIPVDAPHLLMGTEQRNSQTVRTQMTHRPNHQEKSRLVDIVQSGFLIQFSGRLSSSTAEQIVISGGQNYFLDHISSDQRESIV
jgi:hypothetical protein